MAIAERNLSCFQDAIQCRRLQSEISGVQFCNKPFLAPSYIDWVSELEARCKEWKSKAMGNVGDPSECIDIKASYNDFMLHRPCEANPHPCEESIALCFRAIQKVVAGYWETALTDSLKFVWHCAHNCFEAGTVLLHLIIHYPSIFKKLGETTIAAALDVTNQVFNVLCLLSSRWPAALRCAEFFDTLKKETLRGFFGTSTIANTNTTSLNVLNDMVLHRPGDTQYVKDTNDVDVWGEAFNHWSTSTSNLNDTVNWDMFDFSFSVIEFEGMDWAYPITPTLAIGELPQNEIFPPAQTSPSRLTQTSDATKVDFIVDKSYLTKALAQLPPCTKCKRRRTRCDKLLPSCRQCAKSEEECKYYDPVLSQETPRRYLQALNQRLTELINQQEISIKGSSAVSLIQNENALDSADWSVKLSSPPVICTRQNEKSHVPIVHFLFGKASVFSCLSTAASTLSQINKSIDTQISQSFSKAAAHVDHISEPKTLAGVELPTEHTARQLAQQYYYSIERHCPNLGPETINSIIDACYAEKERAVETPSWEEAILWLTLAVGCRLSDQKCNQSGKMSRQMFDKATESYAHLISKQHHPSHACLQLETLVCWYLVLDPAAGNAWRMLGHICRSVQSLRRQLNSAGGGSLEEWTLFTTIFRIEW